MLFLRALISPSSCSCINFVRHARKIADPGIRKRKELLQLDETEDIEDFEDFETDFMEVHKSHKQHVRELEIEREKMKYHIVKQRYFKEKFPNFLTWHDKEQIRFLHGTEPNEWTIERLSESFPALPEVIKKVVKSNWTKPSQDKIANHDSGVRNNWKLFKDGKMGDLPEDLAQHLNKFTNRALDLNTFQLQKDNVVTFRKKIRTEFSEIITSYEKNNHGETEEEKKLELKEKKSSGKKSKNVTLEQLQMKLVKRAESGGEIDQDEKYIITNVKKEEKKVEIKQDLVDLSQNKYQTGVQHHKKEPKDLSHLNYPEFITIPKSVHKKSSIYKLNDCYYDHDGEFLYRVPGMS
ncbi:required for respiratory growth protein 9, mitochondrial [Tribolium madens]|uniref:required for respiratory growth protein 9, mitochondrial n=1 Tax=Tribolium madens TaxID=41895 RepID=UPI001CF728BB|nr:required for respiratory growth protein 9, mitochondrial [Tribolium madens]